MNVPSGKLHIPRDRSGRSRQRDNILSAYETADSQRTTGIIVAVNICHGHRGIQRCRIGIDGIFEIRSRIQTGNDRLVVGRIDGQNDVGGPCFEGADTIIGKTCILSDQIKSSIPRCWPVSKVIVGDATQQRLVGGQAGGRCPVRKNGEQSRAGNIAHGESTDVDSSRIGSKRKVESTDFDHFIVSVGTRTDGDGHLREIGVVRVTESGAGGNQC